MTVDLKRLPLAIGAAWCVTKHREGKTFSYCGQVAQASCVCAAWFGKGTEEVMGQSTAAVFQRIQLGLTQNLDVV